MKNGEIFFEESLSDVWSEEAEVAEVPLDDRPLIYLGLVMFLLALIAFGRILYLGVVRADFYQERAEVNLGKYERLNAPRGLIEDRNGVILAENSPIFSLYLNFSELARRPELRAETMAAIEETLGLGEAEVSAILNARDWERSGEPVPLGMDLTQVQLVALKEKNLPTLQIRNSFRRSYPSGPVFSSVLGYTGLTSASDLVRDPALSHQDSVGKSGLELSYDNFLRGQTGLRVKFRDAKGQILTEQEKQAPQIGQTLRLTIDADLQEYFYERMAETLRILGRASGVGLAMNPQNGEILALLNFPVFDNNIFSVSSRSPERKEILTASTRPLFNRAISGAYTPGSTIKPLVGVAALNEGVIDPDRIIFSPGYLDVPNPYNPDKPTRLVDWRFQGEVDLSAAIAQSSNVYFYELGGGFGDIKGLGINRLREWWSKFGLGKLTGVDLPGEVEGFLPSIEWKERVSDRPWLLGDTYNVSIGQGDLLVTPLQLLNYISAISNGGYLRRPVISLTAEKSVLADLTEYLAEIQEVQKGMRQTVTGVMGTAHTMNDLPFSVAGKTGSAQVKNNAEENAFFVGYAPYENPEIAILILVENSRQGSLNAVPIAKDVLNWYYEHKLKGEGEKTD